MDALAALLELLSFLYELKTRKYFVAIIVIISLIILLIISTVIIG
jgi:hypothetical protein